MIPLPTTALNTAPPSTMDDENATTPNNTSTHTPSTINTKDAMSTIPDGSLSTTSATTAHKLTSTTESLDEDIDHFTSKDQTTTGVLPDRRNDGSVVIIDSKLTFILSATNLAMFLVLAVVVLALVVAMVLLHAHKQTAKESMSTKLNLQI